MKRSESRDKLARPGVSLRILARGRNVSSKKCIKTTAVGIPILREAKAVTSLHPLAQYNLSCDSEGTQKSGVTDSGQIIHEISP